MKMSHYMRRASRQQIRRGVFEFADLITKFWESWAICYGHESVIAEYEDNEDSGIQMLTSMYKGIVSGFKGEISEAKGINKLPIIILAVIIIMVIAGTLLFNSMTAVVVTERDIEAGSVVVTKDLVKAKSSNATITIDGKVNTEVLGENKLKYTVQNGVFKKTKEFIVQVVDTTAPKIKGPDSVTVIVGQEFEPSNFYEVEDFDEDLKDKIEIDGSLDTDYEGKQELTLIVKDSSGNEGKLDVTVKLLKLSKNEEKVLAAINQYIADGNSKDKILSSVWVMKTSGATNGVDYYVEVASDVLYAIDYSGNVSEFTVSDCGGSTMHSLMVYAVQYDGTKVSTSKLIN